MTQHTDTIAGTAAGLLLSIVGMITQLIHVESILQAAIVAFVGATVSFFTTQMWKLAAKRIKSKRASDPTDNLT